MKPKMRRQPFPASRIPVRLVLLDPATARCGVAVFQGGRLIRAATIRATPLLLPGAVLDFADVPAGAVWMTEVPQTYDRARAKDPDLEGLRQLIGRVQNVLPSRMYGVLPFTWKGNVPKKVCQDRAEALLGPSERAALCDTVEDTWDATGIGLWALGRAGQGLTARRTR